jgi:hypothetical protein
MLAGLKTITGILITVAPLGASLFGYDTAPNFTGEATEIAAALVTLIGAGIALYGRIVAQGPLWFRSR